MAIVAIKKYGVNWTGPGPPYMHAVAVTPSDTDDLTYACCALLITGLNKALTVDMEGGETVTFPAGTFPAGTIIPLRVTRVWATGTTATGIFALR